MKQAEAKPRIVAAFLAAHPRERSGNDVFVFYQRLSSEHSPLLSFRFSGDKYQLVQAWLSSYITK